VVVKRSKSRWIFTALVAGLALQRLAELRYSRHNETRLRLLGGREHAPGQLKAMKIMHTAWLLGMLGEVFGLRRTFRPALAALALPLFLLGQGLRYAAILTLGGRWSVRVITIPGASPVTKGVYRYMRHPNYLGVMLEVAAFPLLHSAYWTAGFFSLVNALILSARIRVEEQALQEDNGYWAFFDHQE